MTSSPRLSELPLWERHEERVLAILRRALVLLGHQLPLRGEPALNRALYFCILTANKEQREGGGEFFDYQPVWEGRNPPSPDTLSSSSERKIPDFYWGFIDQEEPDPHRAVRNFTIECKRLGPTSAGGWAFNTRYVDDGVIRFIDPRWRYGKDVSSGAMIGYIENSTALAVLADVNAIASVRSVPVLAEVRVVEPLYELTHAFVRSFAISPFRLTHLWLEPRSHHATAKTRLPRAKAAKRSK